jgi:putative nucleotidyltransferase with HDIG domain
MLTEATLQQNIPEIAKRLPPFPIVVAQLLSELENPSLSMEALVRIARNDPIISANILTTANRIRRFNAMPDLGDPFVAASLIGINQIRRIIATIGMNRFLEGDSGSGFLFWHSRGVAIVAQELAMLTGMCPERAYVAAILHDVGQLCFHILSPKEFQAAYHQSASDDRLLEREAAIFGSNHSQVGAALARHWELPDDFVSTIRDHHDQYVVSSKLSALINLAESLSRALDIPPSPKNRLTRLNRLAMDTLEIDWKDPVLIDCFGRCRARYKQVSSHRMSPGQLEIPYAM